MALLALLVSTRERGMTRDKVIAYLWPDADAEHGRRYLSDSIYRINQAINADAVSSAGDILRLDAVGALQATLIAFEEAIEQRRHEKAAAALYAGPFLDGFFVRRRARVRAVGRRRARAIEPAVRRRARSDR